MTLKKKLSFIILFQAVACTFVQATERDWDTVGNGGWVVARKIKDENGKYKLRAWMVDYKIPFFSALAVQTRPKRKDRIADFYTNDRKVNEMAELRLNGLFNFIDHPNFTFKDQTVITLVSDAVARLSRLDSELAMYLNYNNVAASVSRDFMMERGDLVQGRPIYGEYTGMVHFGDISKSGLSLKTRDFSAHLLLPRGLHPARLRPVAVQDARRFGERNYLQVSPLYLNAMDVGQTAILVLHELLYSYAYNRLNHRDSNSVSALNAYAFSGSSATDSLEDFTKYKKSIGWANRQ